MRQRRAIISIIAALGCGAYGCGNEEPVDLGSHAALGAALSDYQGDWQGYAEAFAFGDGSDVVTVRLDAQGEGVLEFGEAEPLPPPDPDLGYPPNGDAVGTAFGSPLSVVSGFSYPISEATIEDRRIRLSSSMVELYREWCALIPPVRDDANSEQHGEDAFSCIPNVGFRSGEDGCQLGDGTPIDCGKPACMAVCQCAADACGIREPLAVDLRIDAALQAQGEELIGTLVIDSTRINVRLMRL